MLLSLCACRTPEPSEQNDVQYVFEDITCTRKESGEYVAETTFSLKNKDVETLKAMLNGAAWQPDCLKLSADYIFTAEEIELQLILGEFCINDQTNSRHFILSDEQKMEMLQLLITNSMEIDYRIDTPEYVFEEDFECTRKYQRGGIKELTFPMLAEDVATLQSILENAEWKNDCMKVSPNYVFSWSDKEIHLFESWVNDWNNRKHFQLSGEQRKLLEDILAKYPLDLLPGQEGTISYGDTQLELPSMGIDLLCGVVNGAVWTLGEPKAVCSYKITLDGRELEYSPEGVLHDLTNGRYVLVTQNQKNKINALIELLVGTIESPSA
jgi:hypothetical protein